MKTIKNEKLIKRNAQIGSWTTLAALVVLGVGMYLSFTRPELFTISLIALLLGLRQFVGFAWETTRTVLDAVTWQAHPAIFGHTMLVLAALFAIVVPSARLRVLALALGAVGVILSGAREAMFAWLFVAVGLQVHQVIEAIDERANPLFGPDCFVMRLIHRS